MAAWSDWKYYRIPNRLIIFGIVSGIMSLVFQAADLEAGSKIPWLLLALSGFLVRGVAVLVLGIFLHSLGMIGAADLKLVVLLAAWLGFSETKNKVQWSRLKDGQLIPKPISGAAFLPTLYEIFKWDKKCKYRILGVAHQKDNENVLIFNMDDTEIRIPTNTNDVSAPNNNTPDTISDSKSVLAYPADWMNSFGNNYYTQSQAPELTEFTADKNWQTASESKPYKEPELQTTPKETIIQNIKNIITEIKGDTQ